MVRTAYIVAAAALIMTTAASAADRAPSATRGKATFIRANCFSCHGTQGQGAGGGTTLAPNPLPQEALTNFVRNTTSYRMPSYPEAALSDADLADIHAYLSSIPKAASPDTIAILKNLKPTK